MSHSSSKIFRMLAGLESVQSQSEKYFPSLVHQHGGTRCGKSNRSPLLVMSSMKMMIMMALTVKSDNVANGMMMMMMM